MKIFPAINQEVIELLKAGAVGIVRSDTVYGIITPLKNKASVERILRLKVEILNL